jgi:hypothetical protein
MFCCEFLLWAKELISNDINKEILIVYGGECLLSEAVPPWWRTFN